MQYSEPFFSKCTEFLKADILIGLCLCAFFFLFCHLFGGSPCTRCAGDLHVAVIYIPLSTVYLGKSHNKNKPPSQ